MIWRLGSRRCQTIFIFRGDGYFANRMRQELYLPMNAPMNSVASPARAAAPTLSSVESAARAAERLVPEVRELSASVEADRQVSRAMVAKIRDSGLFGLVAPKVFGGSELGVEALVRVVIELASG